MSKKFSKLPEEGIVVIDPRIFAEVGIAPLVAMNGVNIVIPFQCLEWVKPKSRGRNNIYDIRLSSATNFIDRVRLASPSNLAKDTCIKPNSTNTATLRISKSAISSAVHPDNSGFNRIIEATIEDEVKHGKAITVISNDLTTRLAVYDSNSRISAISYPKPPTKLPQNRFIVNIDRDKLSDSEKLSIVQSAIKKICDERGIPVPRQATAVIPYQRSDNGNFTADMFIKDGYDISELQWSNVRALKVTPAQNSETLIGARGTYEQTFALESLLDNRNDIVALGGTPGGGKSFLALAAAIALCKQKPAKENNFRSYDQIVVFRSVIPVGGEEEKLGFLPGDQDEKLAQVAQPVYMNLAQIFKTNCRGNDNVTIMEALETAKADNAYGKKLSILPLRNIRGTTYTKSIVILDDAQNVKQRMLTDLMARLAPDSRLFITYDVHQNDSDNIPDNGIMPVLCELERMQQLPNPSVRFAYHEFTTTQRHAMAKLAEDMQANFEAYGSPASPFSY